MPEGNGRDFWRSIAMLVLGLLFGGIMSGVFSMVQINSLERRVRALEVDVARIGEHLGVKLPPGEGD